MNEGNLNSKILLESAYPRPVEPPVVRLPNHGTRVTLQMSNPEREGGV